MQWSVALLNIIILILQYQILQYHYNINIIILQFPPQTYIVSRVDRSPALQEKVYGWYRGEVTDGISPHRGGVSTAGQVERTGASSSLGSHLDELVDRLLHVVHLRQRFIQSVVVKPVAGL